MGLMIAVECDRCHIKRALDGNERVDFERENTLPAGFKWHALSLKAGDVLLCPTCDDAWRVSEIAEREVHAARLRQCFASFLAGAETS